METLGFSSTCDSETMARAGLMKNLPITVDDIRVENDIFGPDVPSLKGKSIRWTPTAIITDYIAVSQCIYDHNPKVVVVVDFMYVNGILLAMVS